MIDDYCKVKLKGNNHYVQFLGENNPDDQFSGFYTVNKQNLWCNKFWIMCNNSTKSIHIYETATMQLHQILPFPYFRIRGIKWNQQQSSCIVFNGYQNCVIEQVSFDTIIK